jgi:hypothetical protein
MADILTVIRVLFYLSLVILGVGMIRLWWKGRCDEETQADAPGVEDQAAAGQEAANVAGLPSNHRGPTLVRSDYMKTIHRRRQQRYSRPKVQ